MNLEVSTYHETWPKNLAEVDKYLFKLNKKVGGVEEKETHNVEFYKELAKKLREYGIDKIKTDIEKSDLTTVEYTKKLLGWHETIISSVGGYSTFFTEINWENFKVNFVNSEEFAPSIGWQDPNTNEIYINVSVCETAFELAKHYLKLIGLESNLDIYDFISWVVVHEKYHQEGDENETNADLKALEMLWELNLVMKLSTCLIEIVNKSRDSWLDEPHIFWDYAPYTEIIKRYILALENVVKDNWKEVEFENAKKIMLNRVKTGRVEINRKKEKKYIEKDGQQIRQAYYRDENGEFLYQKYKDDQFRAFAPVLTPDILQKIIEEYKRLSEVK